LALPAGATADVAWDRLVAAHPALGKLPPCALAVNRSYAERDTPLADGDELALLPPVSGG